MATLIHTEIYQRLLADAVIHYFNFFKFWNFPWKTPFIVPSDFRENALKVAKEYEKIFLENKNLKAENEKLREIGVKCHVSIWFFA